MQVLLALWVETKNSLHPYQNLYTSKREDKVEKNEW